MKEVKNRNPRKTKKTMTKMKKKRETAVIIAEVVIILRKFSAVGRVQWKIHRKDMLMVGKVRRYLKIIVLMS